VDDVFGRLFIPGRKPLSVEEMNEAIGKKVKSRSGGQCDESA
jgi:hypothetical protein